GFANFFDASFDLFNRAAKILLAQPQGGLGPGLHHQDLRTKLLQGPNEFIRLGMCLDEIEYGQIAVGVADDALVVLELQEADVAMVVLESFELYFGDFFARKGEIVVASVMFGFVLAELILLMFVERGGAEGTLSIGSS